MDPIVKTGVQSADDPFKFVLSTEDKDRDGDVIVQRGWSLASFKKNPIALFGHSANNPIGTWENVSVEGGKLVGTLKMAAAGTSQLVDEVRSLLEQRILRAVSVGFSVQKHEPIDPDDQWGAYKFLKQTLLECSVVSVPANQNALMVRGKALGIRQETLQALVAPVEGRKSRQPVSGTRRNSNVIKGNNSMNKMGDKIKAAVAALEDLRADVTDIVKSAEDDNRDLTEAENLQIQALSDEIASAESNLEGLETAEKAINATKQRRETERSTGVPMVPARVAAKELPGSMIWKQAAVAALAHVQKKTPDQILEERYSHDPRVKSVHDYLIQTKAAQTIATTTAAGWAAELVESDVGDFISSLEAISVYGAMASGGIAIPFGNNNTVTMPRRNGKGHVSGSFVGEGATIPVKSDQFGSETFNRYKAAVITTFSNELARTSTPQVEALLRESIQQDTGDMLDNVLLAPANAAIAGIRPASPWNGAANQASAGVTLDNVLTDLRFLMSILSDANAGRKPMLILNPDRVMGLSMATNANGSFIWRDEIATGRIMGIPFLQSTNVPKTTVFIIDLMDFATAFGSPEFDASDQVSLAMADDDGVAPTMADTNAINDAGGSIHLSDAAGTTPPTVVRSMFQTWSSALRMVMPISWGTLRTGTAGYITGANW